MYTVYANSLIDPFPTTKESLIDQGVSNNNSSATFIMGTEKREIYRMSTANLVDQGVFRFIEFKLHLREYHIIYYDPDMRGYMDFDSEI